MSLADGRRLAYEMMGTERGYPVVALHGTPGSSRQLAGFDAVAYDQGIRLIAPDRPGYGRSSHHAGRTFASSAADMGELLDHLHIDSCAVVGLSGGGPFALACGVVHPHRVSTVATVGSVAPPVADDLWGLPDWMTVQLARRSERIARWAVASTIGIARVSPERALSWLIRIFVEPDGRLVRERPELHSSLLEDLRHPSPTTAHAAARDYWLFTHPWDVDLADLSVPAHIWHGSADRIVPVKNASVVVGICRTAELRLVRDGGHMLVGEMGNVLGGLKADGP